MRRIIIYITALVLAFQTIPCNVFATEQEKPKNVRVKTIDGEPSFGFDSTPYNLGYYVDIKWDKPEFAEPNGYYKLFYKADGENYMEYGDPLGTNDTEARISKLDSGKIYHAYVKAYHTHSDDEDEPYRNQTHQSNYNPSTDNVYFLTGLQPEAQTVSSNEISITWEDVKLNENRIGYNLYISEDSNFTNTVPIIIEPEDVENGRVSEYKDDKLKYVVSGLKSSTMYYIKVKPVIKDLTVTIYPKTKVINSYTYIPATIEKYSQGDTYDIWKMQWNNITSSIAGTENIEYVVLKGEEGGLWQSIGGQTDVVRYIKEYKDNEKKYYYKVRVYLEGKFDEYGDPLYLESNEVNTHSYEIPYTPPIPEIMETVEDNEDEKMDITQNSIEIIWDAVEVDGSVDKDIYYDIWLLTESNLLNDDEVEPYISGFQPTENNYIFKKSNDLLTSKITAYSYKFKNLDPNTVYYIKLVARKKFMVYENEQVKAKDFISEPAIKVIQTETNIISVPTAPIKPNFRISRNEDGTLAVTQTSAKVEWDTGWEEYQDEDGNWIPINEDNVESVGENVYKRINTYDEGVKFGLGYMELTQDINYNQLRDEPLQVTDIENPYKNTYGTIEYEIEDLESNNNYIVWIRAYRDLDTLSEPSEPLIVSTKSDYTIPLEKPPVPRFNYSNAIEDNGGIEIDWDRSNERDDLDYTYYLKWSNEDDINTAGNSVEVKPEYFNIRDTYLVEDLEPSTPYYFWVQVEITRGDESVVSQWSNSLGITTTSYLAPEKPTGFGVAEVDKHHITYEWNWNSNLQYYLEVSRDEDFDDSETFSVDDKQKKVESLHSNTLYYARLFAYDQEKDLFSEQSYIIEIKTKRSDNEYDSDVPDETVITGPIQVDEYDSGTDTWTKKIIGVNGDRFIENVISSHVSQYEIDMDEPPKKYGDIDYKILMMDYNIIKMINDSKKDLVINTGKTGLLIIRPDVIVLDNNLNFNSDNLNLHLKISNHVNKDIYSSYINPITLVNIDLAYEFNETVVPVKKFNNTLKIQIPYSNKYIYNTDEIKAIMFNKNDWEIKEAIIKFKNDEDTLITIEMKKPCIAGIATINNNMRFADLYNHWARNDINNVFKKYDIVSMKNARMFYPNEKIIKKDLSKLILDILGEEYSNTNYFEKIYKAGLLDFASGNDNISRQEFSKFLVRFYKLKTGKDITQGYVALEQFEDYKEISSEYKEETAFLVSKGIYILRNNKLEPNSYINRAEALVMIKNILEEAGEI